MPAKERKKLIAKEAGSDNDMLLQLNKFFK